MTNRLEALYVQEKTAYDMKRSAKTEQERQHYDAELQKIRTEISVLENAQVQTRIIATYPCLGKTTLGDLNKKRIFDREFNESRSIIGMTETQIDQFFKACADIICLQADTNTYEIMFITEDDRLLRELAKRDIKPTLVFPNIFDDIYMKIYDTNVIMRSGLDWWKRVIEPERKTLEERIVKYKNAGYDVKLTNRDKPYIEDVIALPYGIIKPAKK